MTTPCKSPAHKRYTYGLEALYIQTALASKDLEQALAKARADNANEPYLAFTFQTSLVDEALERIAFGRSEFADAEKNLNAHFDRGCRNLKTEEKS